MNIFKRLRRRKGGSSYASDIFIAVTCLFIMFATLTIATITSFFVDYGMRGTVYGTILHKEPVTENLLINYMDSSTYMFNDDETSHRVGDLITIAVWRSNTTYILDGKQIDLNILSKKILSGLDSAIPRKLTLTMGGEEYILNEIKGDYTSAATVVIKAEYHQGKLTLER
jgi:hypothetical protein